MGCPISHLEWFSFYLFTWQRKDHQLLTKSATRFEHRASPTVYVSPAHSMTVLVCYTSIRYRCLSTFFFWRTINNFTPFLQWYNRIYRCLISDASLGPKRSLHFPSFFSQVFFNVSVCLLYSFILAAISANANASNCYSVYRQPYINWMSIIIEK